MCDIFGNLFNFNSSESSVEKAQLPRASELMSKLIEGNKYINHHVNS